MASVNFSQFEDDPERLAEIKGAARRAKRALYGGGPDTADIDHDIRGMIWGGHLQELEPGKYFDPGGDPENPTFYDIRQNKINPTADMLAKYRGSSGYRRAIAANPGGGDEEGEGGSGGGLGTPGSGMFGQIEGLLSDSMSGKFSRYGDDTVQRLKGQAFETGQSRLKQQLGSVDQEAAREGLGGAAVAALRQRARGDTAKDYSSASRDIANQKVQADYEDRKAALEDAMNYVNQTREYELGKAKNQIDRDRIESEAAVARERIASESSMLDRQLSAQADLAAKSAAAGARGQNSSQNFQREMANLRHDWEIENRGYMMPLQLAQLAI